jgi:hypothetical protein
MMIFKGEHGPELDVRRAFTEALHPRGTGAVGGQFVAAGGASKAPAQKAAGRRKGGGGNLSFDGKRGAGYGKKGGDKRVKALQNALNKLGLTDGSGKTLAVDGKLGPRTTAAIKKAQRRLGLKADGVVTTALLRQLTGAKSAKDLKKAPKKASIADRVAAARKKVASAGARKNGASDLRARAAAARKAANAPAKKAAPEYTRKPTRAKPIATVHRSEVSNA